MKLSKISKIIISISIISWLWFSFFVNWQSSIPSNQQLAAENFINTTKINQPLQCTWIFSLYLNQDNDLDNIPDVWLYLHYNRIFNHTDKTKNFQLYKSGSIVQYYIPFANMLSKQDSNWKNWNIDNNTFYRASRVFPSHTPIRVFTSYRNKIIFEAPVDWNQNNNKITINYIYSYNIENSRQQLISPNEYRYNQVKSIFDLGDPTYKTLSNQKKINWTSVLSWSQCFNYKLSRCGDGVVDKKSSYTWFSNLDNKRPWEQCDAWIRNWKAGNTWSYKWGPCSLNCEWNLEPESYPEVFGS